MKKRLYLLMVLCLAATWVGCQQTEPKKPDAPKKTTQADLPAPGDTAPAVTLVTLKVPNMV